jgi:hypothetical protein
MFVSSTMSLRGTAGPTAARPLCCGEPNGVTKRIIEKPRRPLGSSDVSHRVDLHGPHTRTVPTTLHEIERNVLDSTTSRAPARAAAVTGRGSRSSIRTGSGGWRSAAAAGCRHTCPTGPGWSPKIRSAYSCSDLARRFFRQARDGCDSSSRASRPGPGQVALLPRALRRLRRFGQVRFPGMPASRRVRDLHAVVAGRQTGAPPMNFNETQTGDVDGVNHTFEHRRRRPPCSRRADQSVPHRSGRLANVRKHANARRAEIVIGLKNIRARTEASGAASS